MNIRKIIKETILKESAGISFEVRECANILKKEIDRLVKEADDIEKSNSDYEPTENKPYSYNDYYDGEISHFEDLAGNKYDEAEASVPP